VRIAVLFARPASHYNKSGIKPSAPARPGYIDVDKAGRAVLDALAGIAYRNDRQVAALSIERAWVNAARRGPGAVIEISDLLT
jgi:Holliday junction resolvase RusA-like endonuclease